MSACISRAPRTSGQGQRSSSSAPEQAEQTNNFTTQQQQQYNQIIKIYIEWGNHYLQKAKFKKMIQNLQSDLCDGLLLADVVEAVCAQKVSDINKKPRNHSTMIENIKNCLLLLEKLGVSLDGITAKEIKDGNLKAILGLFFALSKYKQLQKQKLNNNNGAPSNTTTCNQTPISDNRQFIRRHHLQHSINEENIMKQSRLPSPYYNNQQYNATASTASLQRSSRSALPGVSSLKSSLSANSSRSASPSSHSFIPTPRQSAANHTRSSLNEKQLTSIRNGGIGRNSTASGTNGTPYNTPPAVSRSPMLDKYKISSSKEKTRSIGIGSLSGSGSVKRPSSSSGVSSARSERSDSSSSLCNEKQRIDDDRKDNNDNGAVEQLIVKPVLKKKVVIRVSENNKAGKSPTMNSSSGKSEDRLSTHSNGSSTVSYNHNSIISPAVNATAISTASAIASINSTVINTSNIPPGASSISTPLVAALYSQSSPYLVQNKELNENRVSGSGIPKPTAAVKGMAKPTNSVAPMPIPDKALLEKEEITPLNIEEKPPICDKKISEEKMKQEISHVKQPSTGEDDEAALLLNIKPMEPLLRTYKRGIILPHRVTVPSNGFYGSRQQFMIPNVDFQNQNNVYNKYHSSSKFDLKKNNSEDNSINIASGYVSDGDVLQSVACTEKLYNDMDGGYMSEGGAHFYDQYAHEIRIKRNEHASYGATLPKQKNISNPIVQKSTDVLTALSSNSSLHKLNGTINIRGLGPEEGPISPPEPTPTRNVGYCMPPTSHGGSCSSSPVVYRVVGSRSHIKKSDNSQQTDNTPYDSGQLTNNNNNQWKKYSTDGGENKIKNSTDGGHKTSDKRSPSVSSSNAGSGCLPKKVDKRRTSSTSSSREELAEMDYYYNVERKSRSGGNSKVRGVPSSFGYVKRTNSTNTKESRTAQVSAVPRTKVKISGGTQTDIKSYSLGSTAASQLSQGVRERLMDAAITKSPSHRSGTQNYNSSRPVTTDVGSLSDSTYTADLQMLTNPYSSSWFRHGSPYTASLPTRSSALVGLTEADSIESLPAQLHQHRASLTYSRLVGSPAPTSPSSNARLSRSNSISYLRERTFPRSTKSEKMYPSMMQRSDDLEQLYSIPLGSPSRRISQGEPINNNLTASNSQTLSSSTNASSRYNFMSSTLSSCRDAGISRNSPYMNYLVKMNSKEDDVHGSAMSLVSTASSSLYSTAEEKQAQELRRLRKDLSEAQEKVHTLTSQLSTNAHVVSAFEKSLSSMTERLQHLTITAERKDSELIELRKQIEILRKQQGISGNESAITGTTSSPSLARRHTINTTVDSSSPNNANNIARQLSTDSVSSLASLSSACSLSSGNQHGDDKNKKKRGWLRSSFSKAFSKSKKNRNGSVSDIEDSRTTHSDFSAPSSPLLNSPHQMNGHIADANSSTLNHIYSSSPIYDEQDNVSLQNGNEEFNPHVVHELKKLLREKDLVLTDIRLEALSSAHQLESLKDTVIKMRNEMLSLKQDNERLQKIVTNKSLDSSRSSLQTHDSSDIKCSNETAATTTEVKEVDDPDSKKICLSVYYGSHGNYAKYVEDGENKCAVSIMSVYSTTNWETLDSIVSKAFKDYLERIDSDTSLGLGIDSMCSYHVGEIVRHIDSQPPELLPCGYLIGGCSKRITLCLKGAMHDGGTLDALSFETLIPKPILSRYMSLLSEHRRIMLCGPSGTGKSYLANKLAEFLVYSCGKEPNSDSISTFNVDEKSRKDLRQYLSNVADQPPVDSSPVVIILRNLHNASTLNEVFTGLLTSKSSPFIIGTINQPTCSSTNLQLHHNFRWVLCANHMEPMKGFLGRYLRRKLIEEECEYGSKKRKNTDLTRVVEWIPIVQQHLNQFLELHSSPEVTIGPKLFMSCPMELDGSQIWFTDLWNYSLVPYLLDAVRDGLQMYGKRGTWQDPCQFIIDNYPWSKSSAAEHAGIEALVRLRPEDAGYETKSESDPLLNMLMTLQEAANYQNVGRTVDSNSVDHHLTSSCS